MFDKGLAESGILGTSFNWWIGQIADDSTWRRISSALLLKIKMKTKDGVEDIK